MITKENALEYIPLLEALADGELEIKLSNGNWVSVSAPISFNSPLALYRRTKLQVEVGKYYKQRNGLKAFVGCESPNPRRKHFQMIGWRLHKDGLSQYTAWRKDGRYYSGEESAYDLIEEWSES